MTKNIIGIHNTGILSSVCLLTKNNELIAIPEERLSRRKYDKFFPKLGLEKILSISGLKYEDIDEFIISWNPALNINEKFRASLSEWQSHPAERFFSNANIILPEFDNNNYQFTSQIFHNQKGKPVKITFLNHHLAHIANSFYLSNFAESAVLSCDAYGEKSSTVFAYCQKDKIDVMREVHFPHSIGMIYSTFTQFLGFRPHMDEWKVMALASYGDQKKFLKKMKNLIKIKSNGDFELNLNYFNFYNFDKKNLYNEKIIKLFGKPRLKSQDPILQRHKDLAAALQKITEDYVISAIKSLKKVSKSKNLSLTGGVFMNSVLNGKIFRSNIFKNVYVPFSPDDSGNAIGAVLWRYKKSIKNATPLLGFEYSNKFISKILVNNKIKFQKIDNNMEFHVSKLLFDEKIICWFKGQSEFGQRALGNRSILASPLSINMKDKLNRSIKFREGFRPFAACIIEEEANNYFISENKIISPYMEKVFTAKKRTKLIAPSIVHFDNSTRLQTINKSNKSMYKLLKNFQKLSDCPMIINTSFNLNNEPIVENPEQAIRTFFSSGADILILENYLITK